jgi:prolyl-tRNA editing enzyme YbaK/EbsC (Cys-tRNA(Pro) deacylase)
VPDDPVHPSVQRVLDAAARKGVTLEVTTFAESTHTAAEAAAAVGAELGQIVKSLVFVIPANDGLEPLLCLVAGHNRVDLARLAAVSGASEIRRASAREARALTGFSIGGIPPIGHLRPVRAIMDPDLGRYPVVWAAAGLSTAVFPVPPATLRILSNATVSPIADERTAADREAEAATAEAATTTAAADREAEAATTAAAAAATAEAAATTAEAAPAEAAAATAEAAADASAHARN